MIRSSSTLELERRHISIPEAIEFPTEGGLTTHAFYYPPANADFSALPSDRPPLIVISHGGPTTQTKAALDLQVQFLTSRGVAVVDVNYGGSSCHGRGDRERVNRQGGLLELHHKNNAGKNF